MTGALVFSAAALVLSGFSFVFFLSYLRRRTSQERILGEFRDEIDRMIAEIDSATDRDVALVEDRIRSLRGLLEDADKRIALHARELDRRQSQERAYRELGKNRPGPAEALEARPFAEFRPAVGESRPAGTMTGDDGRAAVGEIRPAGTLTGDDGRAVAAGELRPAGTMTGDEGRAAAVGEVRPVGASGENPAGMMAGDEGRAAVGESRPAGTLTGDEGRVLAETEVSPAGAAETPADFPRFVRSPRPVEPKPLPFAEQVAELHRQGFSAGVIASRLGAALAEVDLAIAILESRGL